MSRPTATCPKCGGPAHAASYRATRKPGRKSTSYLSMGRAYCPDCDYLLPRPKK